MATHQEVVEGMLVWVKREKAQREINTGGERKKHTQHTQDRDVHRGVANSVDLFNLPCGAS